MEKETLQKWNQEINDNSKPEKPILTMEYLERILTGEDEYPEELNQYINSNVECSIISDFYYNSYEIVNNNYYKIELTSYYRPAINHINITLNPEYDLLLDYMQELTNAYYYASIEYYNSIVTEKHQIKEYRTTIETEELELFLYEITEQYLEQNLKTALTDPDIILILTKYNNLKHINYKKLFQDIKNAWKNIIQNIEKTIDEKLQIDFYEEVILPTEEYYLQELYNNIPIPIKDLPTL